MRIIFAAVFSCVVCLTLTAFQAQASYCIRPSEPYIPSGYIAEHYQMRSTQSEVESYVEEMRDYLECLAREHSDAQNELETVIDEWQSAVAAYNTR